MRRRAFILGSAAAGLATAGLAAETSPRIVMFGDSLTEGFGVRPSENLVAQSQDWLDVRDIPARLVNQGLTGDTSYGGRIRVTWAMRGGADGMVVELGANDFLMGFPLNGIEQNLDAILTRATARDRPVLLVGLAPPQGRTKADRPAITAMWQRLAERHGTLLLPDLYAPIWRARPRTQRELVQEDGLHLSAKGVAVVVEEVLGPKLAELIGEVRARDL